MKKFFKILIVFVLIIGIAFGVYYFKLGNADSTETDAYADLKTYIKNIYGKTFLIPEFTDINEADENWLWENINQYLWNNDDIYKEQNAEEYGYTYDEISKIAQKLYGDDLKKSFPTGSTYMRQDKYSGKYGPTSYGLEYYYDYVIDSINQNGNIYTVTLYDYTVSLYRTLGDTTDYYIDIFNNYEYNLNGDNGTPVVSTKSLKSINISDYKDKLSKKTLTIKLDEGAQCYNIVSCAYNNETPTETLYTYYKKMQNTFEIWYIDYDYDEVYSQSEMLVNNFDELSSIYTENALSTYKNEMNLFVFKDNGEVYITAGDINIGDYIYNIRFESVTEEADKITATAIRTFRESFDSEDENYNNTYEVKNTFTIVKQSDGSWLIDEFSYNNL
jgi:hypothetical protein